jgi:hypothetical protein
MLDKPAYLITRSKRWSLSSGGNALRIAADTLWANKLQ